MAAPHLDVDGCRQAEVDNSVHQSSCLEVGVQFRKVLGKPSPYAVHVLVAAYVVTFLADSPAPSAVCWPELLVYIEEKPGVTPMLETTMPRSLGGTTSRMTFSTLLTYAVGEFEPGAGRGLQVDHELPGIGARKERDTRAADRATS